MESYRNSLNPQELAVLQSVLDQFCSERGLARGSVEREDAADDLVKMFQSGVVSEGALREKLNAGH